MSEQLPPEVIEAAARLGGGLAEHPVSKQPELPAVFQEIIKNDNERQSLRAKFLSGLGTAADWVRLGSLVRDMKLNLRPSAEKALSWNMDKGTTR